MGIGVTFIIIGIIVVVILQYNNHFSSRKFIKDTEPYFRFLMEDDYEFVLTLRYGALGFSVSAFEGQEIVLLVQAAGEVVTYVHAAFHRLVAVLVSDCVHALFQPVLALRKLLVKERKLHDFPVGQPRRAHRNCAERRGEGVEFRQQADCLFRYVRGIGSRGG